MLMLEILLDLKSKQADLTAVFLHDTVGKDEKVYVEITFGFLQHSSKGKFKFLCLKGHCCLSS